MSQTGPSGGRRGAVKYMDIPGELRRCGSEYSRLRRAGEPVPEDVRIKNNLYKRWLARGGKDPNAAKMDGVSHTYIPEDLRRACAEYNRLKRHGRTPSAEVLAKHAEYHRWLKHGGRPPEKGGGNTEWPRSAYLEWVRLIKAGTPPGDIPSKVAEGRAEYLGTAPRKYTECAPSDHVGGRGCRGRHGNGPRRLPYGPGVAACTSCMIAYRDVPDDVTGCGCCGKPLRKSARSKS